MKYLLLVTILASFNSNAFAREFVDCQSLDILYQTKTFVFMNKSDGLKPDWSDLVVGSDKLGLYFVESGAAAQVVSDATVEIKELIKVDSNKVAMMKYSIKTTSTSLSSDPFGNHFRHKAEGWILCGDYGG